MYDVGYNLMYARKGFKYNKSKAKHWRKGETVKILILCIIVSCLALPLRAITVETIVAELNVRHQMIMEKAGTIKISQSIRSLFNGDEVDAKQVMVKKGTRYRIETIPDMRIDQGKTTNIVLFDGENVWFVSPFTGKALMPKDESIIKGIFDDYSKLIPSESVLAEDEELNGEECYVIKIPAHSGSVLRKVWISKERFVPLRALGRISNSGFMLNYTEYKKVYGIWGIPYRTESFSITTHPSEEHKGKLYYKPSSIITVDNVELGLKLEDKIFEIESQ